MKQKNNTEYSAVRRQTGQCGYLLHTEHPAHAAFGYVVLNAPTRPLMREAVKAMIPQGFLDEGLNAKFNACAKCKRCVPVRINLDKYKSRRSARRLRRNNEDLTCSFKDIDKGNIKDSLGTDQFDLFSHFHNHRFPATAWPIMTISSSETLL